VAVSPACLVDLANAIEPSMCGGDAALCQITLITCQFLDPAMFHDLYCKLSRSDGHLAAAADIPFTRYNRLSNRLKNRFDNRLYRVNGL